MPNSPEAVVGYLRNPLHLRIIAYIVCACALLVMAGWIFKSEMIVQINPAFETIKFNSAVLMFLCGLALYYTTTHRNLSGSLGIFHNPVLCGGGLTICFQYKSRDRHAIC